MELLTTVAKWFLVLFALTNIVATLVLARKRYQLVITIWQRFTLGIFLRALCTLAVVIVTSSLLYQFIPVLRFSWLHLLNLKAGNILVSPVIDGGVSSSKWVQILPIVFVLVFAYAMHFMVETEEKQFRQGHATWGRILPMSLAFGLVHCIVGVPLAVGLGLSVAGLSFAWTYKQEYERALPRLGNTKAEVAGVMASTVVHAMYNLIVIALLLMILIPLLFFRG